MAGDLPPVISIAGSKNSGKTTLLVALAAELRRRRIRVASVKHGHHDFEVDEPGRDSWRHFHEGEVEAVLLLSASRLAMVMRLPEEADPQAVIARFYGGSDYDLVLVEGYKHGPFPKIEIHRSALGAAPVYDAADAEAAALFLAVATDDAAFQADCPVIPLDPRDPAGSHVRALADLIQDHLAPAGADDGG